MNQKITGFHLDHEQHWVADLECGHKQHVRHDPPWQQRPWVVSEEGRQSKIGTELGCKRCDEFGATIGESVRLACVKAFNDAYEDAGVRGLCEEGRFEVARDAVRALDLKPTVEEGIRKAVIALKPEDRTG